MGEGERLTPDSQFCLSTSPAGATPTARDGLPFPRPIPSQDKFDATWKSLTAPRALFECADPNHQVFVGPYSRGHNTCHSDQPYASLLTEPAPAPLLSG